MRKRARALLVPVILLAMVLTGCERNEELANPTRTTPVVIVTSTIFAPDGSTANFQQWLDGAFTEARTAQ